MDTPTIEPLYIKMHDRDNVAIVANDGGLQRGAQFPCGLKLVEPVPQGHKVALVDLAKGDPVLRYNVVIGRAARDLPAGSWVNEMALEMPGARSLEGLPISTVKPKLLELGFEIVGNTPEQFTTFQAAEFARWKKVIEVGKITAD